MNETIETRGHTTREGMLNLSVDVGIADAEVEVVVQVKSLPQPSSSVSVPAGSNGGLVRRRTEKLDYSLERRWLNSHVTEYAGQWVALYGDRLLAHGNSGREVYEAALALGANRPFITQVELPDELPFGGW